jgi:ankyrin repeat protein
MSAPGKSTAEQIFDAVEHGKLDRVEELLREDPGLVNARNDRGDSVLLAAAYGGRTAIFSLLIDKGAAVSLFEAAAIGMKDRVLEPLRRDPRAANAYSHDGWTPLHLAAFFGHREVAELLLDHGADVNARSQSERFARANTPLHAAAANRQVAVAELLVARGADVNARDGSGFTPLALAANSRSDLMMLLLLEKGAQAD